MSLDKIEARDPQRPVMVPRDLLETALRDLQSPFPMEAQVIARLGHGDTSIERISALLEATKA